MGKGDALGTRERVVMVSNDSVNISAMEITKSFVIVVNLTDLRQFTFRLWIARALFVLGALVLGCRIEVEDGGNLHKDN